jgi:hypothetical protein
MALDEVINPKDVGERELAVVLRKHLPVSRLFSGVKEMEGVNFLRY